MTLTFNLWTEPWIPCIDPSGSVGLRSIRQALAESSTLVGVQGATPPQTAAIYRLLLALLHRVFGPPNRATWSRLYKIGAFDLAALDAYMAQWVGRFDLFDADHPFYQADDDRVQPKSVISLALEMASGNNAVLFDHHLEDDGAVLTAAEAARALITSQAFGVGGLSGPADNFTDAPLGKGVIFLAQGDTLFETLLFNLVVYTPDKPMPSWPDDCPTWEREALCLPERTTARGYLDYLTWPNRKIRLIGEQDTDGAIQVRTMTWAPGLRLAADDPGPFRHALKNDQKGGEAWRVLQFQTERALWRDSLTLFSVSGSEATHTPAAFRHLAGLVSEGHLPSGRVLRFMALGVAKNQAKLEFFRHEYFLLPAQYLDNDASLLADLGGQIKRAEDVAYGLWSAVQQLGRGLLFPQVKEKERLNREQVEAVRAFVEPWGAETRYWAALDIAFPALWVYLPTDPEPARVAWQAVVRRAAQASLRSALDAAGTRRNIWQSRVEAERTLAAVLRDSLVSTRQGTSQSQGGLA